MITIEPDGCDILLRGRNPDRTRWEKKVSFKPYFLVEAKEGDTVYSRSLEGIPLKQIFVSHPAEVPKKKKDFSKTWEANITYVNRYMIDEIKDIEVEPIRIAYLDIETQIQQSGVNVMKPTSPITAICVYDSFQDKFFQFTWHENPEEILKNLSTETNEYLLYICKSEVEMINMFVTFCKMMDFDLWTAWFGEQFDFPYIINRMKLIGLDSNKLSPYNSVEVNDGKYVESIIRGRILLDLKQAYRHKYTSGKESFSLDYIARYEGIGQKEKYKGNLDDLRRDNFEKYLSYNRQDVRLMVGIDRKCGLISFFDRVRRKAKCTFSDIFSNMRVVDFLLLNYCHQNHLALPTTEHFEGKKESPVGGLVIEPKKGVFKGVAVVDMRSLYPSVIISLNMSSETLGKPGYTVKGVTLKKSDETKYDIDVTFDNTKPGIMATVIKDLFTERVKLKGIMKKMKKEGLGESPEFRDIDGTQYALKELLNSFYGVLGNKYFRLYKKEIAGCITAVSRNTNMWMQKVLKENGYTVLYGDTDSIFLQLKSETPEQQVIEGQEILKKLNHSFSEFARTMGIQNHSLEVEFEKICGSVFFEEGKKKRYAYWKTWEGKLTDEIVVVGFEAKRSNIPQISRDFQKKIFEKILKGSSKTEIYDYVKKFKNKILSGGFTPEEIGYPGGLSKSTWEYGGQGVGVPPWVRGVKYANKYYKANIGVSERYKYIYVKKSPSTLPAHDVIAFRDFMPDGYVINYDEIVKDLVDDKVSRIFTALGWSMEEAEGQKGINQWSVEKPEQMSEPIVVEQKKGLGKWVK